MSFKDLLTPIARGWLKIYPYAIDILGKQTASSTAFGSSLTQNAPSGIIPITSISTIASQTTTSNMTLNNSFIQAGSVIQFSLVNTTNTQYPGLLLEGYTQSAGQILFYLSNLAASGSYTSVAGLQIHYVIL